MKNITITVEEKVAQWARIYAAKQNTSISKIVGRVLTEQMNKEKNYGRAMRHFLSCKPTPLKSKGTTYPRREQLYE